MPRDEARTVMSTLESERLAVLNRAVAQLYRIAYECKGIDFPCVLGIDGQNCHGSGRAAVGPRLTASSDSLDWTGPLGFLLDKSECAPQVAVGDDEQAAGWLRIEGRSLDAETRWWKELHQMGRDPRRCRLRYRKVAEKLVILVVFEERGPSSFSERDERFFLELLEPHLVQAETILVGNISLCSRLARCEQAIDEWDKPLVHTDGHGLILSTNPAAERMLAAGQSGLRRKGGHLVACDAECQRSLLEALRWATSTESSNGARRSVSLCAGQAVPTSRVVLHPVAEGGGRELGLIPRQARLVIESCNSRVGDAEQWLRDAYTLTGTEARVAVAMANGGTISSISDSLGVCASTTKSHLKRIFTKMQVSRQGELIRKVLLTSPRCV